MLNNTYGGGSSFGGGSFGNGGMPNQLPAPSNFLGGRLDLARRAPIGGNMLTAGQQRLFPNGFGVGQGGFSPLGGPGGNPPTGGGSNSDGMGVLGSPSQFIPQPNLGPGNYYQDRRMGGGYSQPIARIGY